MRLLYLTHRCPYPPNKGERIRSFHILQHLAQRYETELIYPSFSAEDVQHGNTLKDYAHSVVTVPLHPLVAKLKCLAGLFSSTSLTARYFSSKKLQALLNTRQFDVALADCSSMAQYFLDIRQPRLVDFIDVDSEKWKLYAQQSGILHAIIYQQEYRRLQAFEAHINRTFDACLVVSEEEKQLLPYPGNVTVMPNGIDCQFFSPRDLRQEDTLIFTGAMNYWPNIDAMTYFCREIWPLVHAQRPHVRLLIAGMDPTPQIRALGNPSIAVTGYVPDMRDYLAQATVCVVPLRIAKGLQNKILEAMAMGIPVVATTVANTGIKAHDQQHLLLADHPADFARAIVTLLQDPQLRQTLACKARQFVEERFSWATHLQTLDTLIARVSHTSI